MKKYMKYEIKGSYKFILGILAIVIIASTFIQMNINSAILGFDEPTSMTNSMVGFKAFIMIMSILVIFGAFLTAFFHIVGSFRKELYEDRGYLTFTLPLSGNQIVGAKLIVATLWFIVLGVTIIIYNLLLSLILFGGDWLDIAKGILNMANLGGISVGILGGLSSILTLVLIYFSIALSKVSFKNKKLGGLWFIVFLILNGLAGFITLKISTVAPYYLNLNGFKILPYYQLDLLSELASGMGSLILLGKNFDSYINIMGILSQLIIGVVTFLGTGYLIEKKIDL